jgi:hypothetical protein
MTMDIEYIRENNLFECRDIALASAIFTIGYKIEAIDKSNPTRAIFVFKRDKELDEIVQSFWSHTLQVDPLNYFNSLKEIKTRLYQ